MEMGMNHGTKLLMLFLVSASYVEWSEQSVILVQ